MLRQHLFTDEHFKLAKGADICDKWRVKLFMHTLEEIIAKHSLAELYCLYACYVKKGRWPEAEPIIMKYPEWACLYAHYVIGGPWLEAEPFIMKDAEWAYLYARYVKKGRWPEAEPFIMRDEKWAYLYVNYFLHKSCWLDLPKLKEGPCDTIRPVWRTSLSRYYS